MARFRGWVFTDPADDEPRLIAALRADNNVRYWTFGRETGAGGFRHLQGLIEFRNIRSLAQVRATTGNAHLEPRRGSFDQARAYAHKDDDFIEEGQPLEPGRRTDMETLAERIEERVSIQEIAQEFPGHIVRYGKGVERLRELLTGVKRRWKTEVYVFWGPAGTGKSWRCEQLARNPMYKPADSKWWPDYCADEDVIIEDFDPSTSQISRTEMLRLMDRYPMKVETKGGYVEFGARRLFITSNTAPNDWWREHQDALRRRIEHVENCTEVYRGGDG